MTQPATAGAGRATAGRHVLRHYLGIDRAVLFTLLGRVWSVGAGLLTIVFVTTALSPAQQGFYYTFYSLIALQIFAELGLNYAIVQFGSHEMARMTWTTSGTLAGEDAAKRRLQSLLYFALSWFGVAALLMVVTLPAFGIRFFGRASAAGGPVNGINIPWCLLVCFSAANLIVNAFVALLEGCGRVADVALLRLAQSVASALAVWVLLAGGGQLYAVAGGSGMLTVVGSAWLYKKYRRFFADLMAHRALSTGLDWRREIWPFQWRIAVSFASGYLLTQLFNPLLLASQGAVAAGQMGMSLQMIGAMNGAALAWITTKAPTYGQLIATGRRQELDALFRRGLTQSSGMLLLGVACVWVALAALSSSGSRYATRVLPIGQFSLLCVACLANHVVVALSVYLRAHKEEPFMALSVINGVATATLTLWLVPLFGTAGAVGAYTATTIAIGLLGGTAVFVRKRRQWTSRPVEVCAGE